MSYEADQYYMIISSNDYDKLYPSNSNTYFTIDLPSTLALNNEWEVALTEIWLKSTSDNRVQFNVCSDICVESLVNAKFIQLLRRIDVRKGYNHVIFTSKNYFQINRMQLKNISFYINSVQQPNGSLLRGKVTLQLHFRKRKT